MLMPDSNQCGMLVIGCSCVPAMRAPPCGLHRWGFFFALPTVSPERERSDVRVEISLDLRAVDSTVDSRCD